MKKNLHRWFFVLFCIFQFGSLEVNASWKQYVNLLRSTYPGLTPYKMPHASGVPGNVYHYVGVEQLYCSKDTCFPAIQTLQPDEVPAVFLTQLSQIKFKVGANVSDKNILPQNITGVAGIAFTRNTSANISPRNPKLFRIEEIRIEERLKKLDMSNSQEESLLKCLCKKNYFIVSGALQFDGFDFNFHRDSDLDSSLEAQITQGSVSANLSYRKTSNKDFTLTANTPMFFAYYAYPSNLEEAKRMFVDKLRIRQIQEQERQWQSTAAKISSIEASIVELENFKKRLLSKISEVGEIQSKIETVKGRIQKTKSSRSVETLNIQLQATESELSGVSGEINSLKGVIKAFETEQAKLQQYHNELAALNSANPANMAELKELNGRDYKILEKAFFIPADIAKEFY